MQVEKNRCGLSGRVQVARNLKNCVEKELTLTLQEGKEVERRTCSGGGRVGAQGARCPGTLGYGAEEEVQVGRQVETRTCSGGGQVGAQGVQVSAQGVSCPGSLGNGLGVEPQVEKQLQRRTGSGG